MKQRVKQETLRLSLQSELDSKKTSLERNKLGQFATPTHLAREVVSVSYTHLTLPTICSV